MPRAAHLADNKFLFKNLMNGLKTMLYALRACNPPFAPNENNPSNWNEVAHGFNAEEVKIIIKLFREGAHVFRYYGVDGDAPVEPQPQAEPRRAQRRQEYRRR